MMTRNHPATAYRLRSGPADALIRGLCALGAACLALSALGLMNGGARHFLMAYLVAFIFFLTVSLGGLFFVMLHHVTGARWSVALRRLAEGLMANLDLMLLLFIPLALGMDKVYPWTGGDKAFKALADHQAIPAKAAYLNPVFFLGRSAVYFFVWIGLARILFRGSLKQDGGGSAQTNLSMRRWSAPGLLLFAFTVTFASFDLVMSLDPHWYSTIFGVYLFAGAVVAILAALILAALALEQSGQMGNALSIEHYHDLGKLLFAFVIFWAYIAFSQLLLIWMGNMPEETVWYARRWQSAGWRAVSWLLIVGNFIVPFLFLLPRAVKRLRPALAVAAGWLLLMHYVELYWLIMPALDDQAVPLRATDLFMLAGMGCLYLGVYLLRLKQTALVPVSDPHLAESMAFENV